TLVPSETCQWNVLQSSIYCNIKPGYDVVITNPPFHTHKQTNYDLGKQIVSQSATVLKPEGVLYLVGNIFLNYTEIGEKFFNEVEKLTRNLSYVVYKMSRPKNSQNS
ncbi:MAG: methyltransferase, partial [Fibrobacteria bacterium]|nr:methyltransferase [Fibrobacteria bacterium]